MDLGDQNTAAKPPVSQKWDSLPGKGIELRMNLQGARKSYWQN